MRKFLLCLAVLACICVYEANSQLTCSNRDEEEYADSDVPNRFGGGNKKPKPAPTPAPAPGKKPGKPAAAPPAAGKPAAVKPRGRQLAASGTSLRSGDDSSQECTCVPYHLCSTEPVVHQDAGDCEEFHGGENIIDIRINKKQCENYLDVCCPNENVMGKEQTPCPDPGPDGGDSSEGSDGNNSGGGGHPVDPPPSHQGCGHRNPDGVGFCIIGDLQGESEFGEFPWMVAIAAQKNGVPLYQCGGSLISHSVVLTAAHCVDGHQADDLVIRAGEWDTQTLSEPYPYQDLFVSSVVIHEKYAPKTLYNDVALLFLEKPVEENQHIGTVCLPPLGTVFDRSRCFTSGWGRDVYEFVFRNCSQKALEYGHGSYNKLFDGEGQNGTYQVILKKRDLPIVPRAQCQADLRKTRLGPRFKLHESFICAGGEQGIDACTGDGGSPLVCPLLSDPSKYQQAGIVAWGIGCGEHNTPGVYVDIAQFRPWIDRKMAAENLDTSSYTP